MKRNLVGDALWGSIFFSEWGKGNFACLPSVLGIISVISLCDLKIFEISSGEDRSIHSIRSPLDPCIDAFASILERYLGAFRLCKQVK